MTKEKYLHNKMIPYVAAMNEIIDHVEALTGLGPDDYKDAWIDMLAAVCEGLAKARVMELEEVEVMVTVGSTTHGFYFSAYDGRFLWIH